MEITRWAFNISLWNPNDNEWNLLLQKETQEEINRINKFHFRYDAKLSLVGRILIHKFIEKYSNELGITNKLNIPSLLYRTSKGKPYLNRESLNVKNNFFIDFNVSTAGDYVLFTGIAGYKNNENPYSIGCDVMKLEIRGKDKNIDNFFHTLRSCFTNNEWNDICFNKNKTIQLQKFYERWTLKESYIKAIGLGLGIDLQSFEFIVPQEEIQLNNIETNIKIRINNKERNNWKFELHRLDIMHVCSIGFGPLSDSEEEFAEKQYNKNYKEYNNIPNPKQDKFIILEKL